MDKKNTGEILSANLGALMQVNKMDEKQLSKKTGISLRHIQYILTGGRTPSISIIEKLAAPFRLMAWHLLMPAFPLYIKKAEKLDKLIKDFTSASDQGRQLICRVAENEAKNK